MNPILAERRPLLEGIAEREEEGFVILSPASSKPVRRVLHINAYGGRSVWEKVKNGLVPPHQLLGCLELVRMGYEVAMAEPLPDFYLYRKPLPHDLRLLSFVRSWLGPDGIIYCGHNVLFWLPMLAALGAIRSPIVSLLYAREPLDWSRAHRGIIALTPAAEEQARKLAPKAKISHLGWGVALPSFPLLEYRPQFFLSCGIANRDFRTLSEAAALSGLPLRVICPGIPAGLQWPANADVVDGGNGWNVDAKRITFHDLLHQHYAASTASLIILKEDAIEYTANGFTNLIEALALGRPVIVTRTGALTGEIDVEKAGCGIHVPPGDPRSIAAAMNALARDPQMAQELGQKGRQLCERNYNIDRYARDLHRFFESL
jgi:glycosyltransferase involved in cell wall biosynthesis